MTVDLVPLSTWWGPLVSTIEKECVLCIGAFHKLGNFITLVPSLLEASRCLVDAGLLKIKTNHVFNRSSVSPEVQWDK